MLAIWPIHRRAVCDHSFEISAQAVAQLWDAKNHWIEAQKSDRAVLAADRGIYTKQKQLNEINNESRSDDE